MRNLLFVPEPNLLFRFGQGIEDPRDGLSLFGPLDEGKPHGVRAGVVGTPDGIRRFCKFVRTLQTPIPQRGEDCKRNRPLYPGFEAIFGIPWNSTPHLQTEIKPESLRLVVNLDDRHQRVYATVKLFAEAILAAQRDEDEKADVWFVVVPEEVYKNCRPRSFVGKAERVIAQNKLTVGKAVCLQKQPALFEEINAQATPYLHDPDFRNQLKALLLEHGVSTQILRESTIADQEFLGPSGKPITDLTILKSQIAWNVSSAVFYKTGGRPWKLKAIRTGVCYIGLVFKQDEKHQDPRTACCAAQMFLDSGDGVVFKGNVGPWHTPGRGDYHLSKEAAKELVMQAVEAYKTRNDNQKPSELFIHGKTRFNDEEWEGFKEGGGTETKVVGVRIVIDKDLRLFHPSKTPILRGMAWIQDNYRAYIWTKGFVPRLQTYPGQETPLPLQVDISKGEADIEIVVKDILALTKLNYNACRYADGLPVTLRFADAVGEILVSGPPKIIPPLAFRFYI
jgi:hypothetical protein